MLSRPDDWEFSAGRLVGGSPKEGREACRNAMKELQKAGYLNRFYDRDVRGRVRNVTVVADRPLSESEWADYTVRAESGLAVVR